MKMWEAGAPIEGGNEIGIPDIEYFDYLKDKSGNDHDSGDNHYREYASRKRNLDYDELLKIAKQLYNRGNYNQALNYYNHALDWHYNEEAKCGKAECLHKLGRNDEASQVYYELGDRYAFADEDENIAVKYLKKSLECNPNNEDSLDRLGYALRGLKRYSEALTYYTRVKHKDVNWAMALCYMRLKKYECAIPLLDKEIKECPFCDSHLDEKCECLIGLNRKNEAIELWEQFINFLMKNECYDRALKRLDLLSKNTQSEDDFITSRRSICLKEKESLEIRFKAISKVMSSYHMYNPNGLDENDLYGFMKFVCDESGESIDDIVRWYNTPMLGSSSFKAICAGRLHYIHWEKITDMYKQGKFKDL